MKQTLKNLIVVAALLATSISAVSVAEESSDEVDHVALATRMLKDGHYDRARSVLLGVDAATLTMEERANFYTLNGLLDLDAASHASAVKNFDLAIRNGKVDDIIFVYLAQAFWGQKDYAMTVRSIDNADEEGEEIAQLQLMKAQALRELGEPAAAWNVLNSGSKKFLKEPDFQRHAIFLLVELGLYQEAVRVGGEFLEGEFANADDYLAIGAALRHAGETDRSIEILERARLIYPADTRVIVHLAHTYVDLGSLLVGADLLKRASSEDSALVLESAELYRRAGAFQQAMYMNSEVADQKSKIRQRVSILVDMQHFESVVALEKRAQRLGLFEDQPVLYALAYARFSLGDYKRTETLLKGITEPSLFQNATQLRRIMAICNDDPSAC